MSRKIPVVMHCVKTDKILKIFDSQTEAAEYCGVQASSVAKCASGKVKTMKKRKYYFLYLFYERYESKDFKKIRTTFQKTWE